MGLALGVLALTVGVGAREVRRAVEDTFRTERAQIVATLIRVTGDWDLAEEAAQDAFTQALARWPADGVPRNPGAWLTTAARNRAIDRLRPLPPALAPDARVALTLRTLAGLTPRSPPCRRSAGRTDALVGAVIAADLLLVLAGRKLPAGRLRGEPAAAFSL